MPTTERKFTKSVVGDFTYSAFSSSRRQGVLLTRNIKHLLAHHQNKLLCNGNFIRRPQADVTPTFADENVTHAIDQCSELSQSEKAVAEAASQRCLVIRSMNPKFENQSRRSVRRLHGVAHNDENAELTLDAVSIRKKINFALNRISDSSQPWKRTKSGHVKCICSITIWDNRRKDKKSEKSRDEHPLLKRSVNCTLVTYESDERIPNVNVQLDEPFKIKAKDLKVVLREAQGHQDAVLGICDDYFLELKLIPSKADVEWPPIPVLGKSDGDTQRGLTGLLSAEKLKGALVVRYQKLPLVPESNAPLSVFYIVDGRLHKTKFGLELKALWSIPKSPLKKHEPEVAAKIPSEAWAVDQKGRLFGRKTNMPQRTRKSSPPPKQNGVVAMTPPNSSKKVNVTYVFDPDSASAQNVDKQLRSAEMNDLGCPVCVMFTAQDVSELRFHFLVMHDRYNFSLMSEDDPRHGVHKVLFQIVPVQAKKPLLLNRRPSNDLKFLHVASREPFDITAYLGGDKSWTKETKQKPRALPAPAANLVEDATVALRKQNGGYLAPESVRDFRIPQRKKHRVVALERKIDTKRTPYSSISHRQRSISEDAMSETDDEIDDEWFIDRHLENIDVEAKEEGWSECKTELLRRWNKHRLEEKLDHPRYMSDSLVRFARKEKTFLQNSDAQMQATFSDLLADLVRSRYIKLQFVDDLRTMINGKNGKSEDDDDVVMLDAPSSQKPERRELLSPTKLRKETMNWQGSGKTIRMNAWKRQVNSLPKSSCGICAKTVKMPHKEAILCSNHSCPVTGTLFHMKCAGLETRARDWVCHGCNILKEADKGKARAVD